MKTTGLNAQKLRVLLSVIILLLFAGGTAGFIFARQQLKDFATSIIQLEADAKATDASIVTLQQLEKSIDSYDSVRKKANSMAIEASDYPVGVINTLTGLANQSGVELANVSYGEKSDSTSSSESTPAASESGTIQPPGAAAPTTPAAPGVTKKTLNVTMKSPLDYDRFMDFLKKIENHPTYLHIVKVSMTKDSGNLIKVEPLTVEVYLR